MDDLHIDRLEQQARLRLRHGDAAGAAHLLCEALGLDPERADLHSQLALALLRQKRWTAARHEAALGLAGAPDSPFAHYVSALVHDARGLHRQALPHHEQAAALAPDDADIQLALGRCLGWLGRAGAAQESFDRALALDPASADVLAAHGDWRHERHDLAGAEEFYARALQEEPQHLAALVGMGHVLLARGDVAGAREHAVWALQQNAGDERALVLLAGVKARQSRLLGLWWRFNSWLSAGGEARAIVLAIALYLAFQVLSIVLLRQGRDTLSHVVDGAWLLFVAYTWVGPLWFQRKLKEELGEVRLARDF